MSDKDVQFKSYAYLPEDLLINILEQTPKTAMQLSKLIGGDDASVKSGIEHLLKLDLIETCQSNECLDSLIAVDGAQIVQRMTGSDILMSIAVGVEGLPEVPADRWSSLGEQYYHWQAALPHHVANARLTQGIMFLMELSILAKAQHKVRILDGSHITTILKLNSLLSAHDDEFADKNYVEALNSFLKENYSKVIPDIPDIIEAAFRDPGIIALAKYSSSREMLDSFLANHNIVGDDKTFFSLALKANQYTKPLPVGQSEKENKQWKLVHIKCNLPLDIDRQDAVLLNNRLAKSLLPFRPKENEESELYFSYYKPFEDGLSYRIELKKGLAQNKKLFESYLTSIKRQIFFPEIQEPYPQYLADIIAKNISFGMEAVMQAVRSNPLLSSNKNFHLMLSYRTN